MKRERLVHRRALVEWGRLQPESLALSGDLTAPCEADGFQEAYPDRFISMGLMEQNMMGFAAGLAREGFVPLVHTFGVFMYRRALDQVEMSIAYADLPVRMFGFLPGVSTPGGPSHQATNDVAVLRSLPNMSIVDVGDATDIEGLYGLSLKVGGPLYVRMLRGEVPRIFPQGSALQLNRARVLSQGTDIALLTSGICTEEALRVTDLLREAGRLKRISIGDRYLQGASQPWLMENFDIGAKFLVEAVETLLGQGLGISAEAIASAEASDFTAENQMEAL